MEYEEVQKRNMKGLINTHCMECRKEGDKGEILHTGEVWEMWVYCKSCDVETFHPAEPE
tara:strand:- start:748 stop:924 length:177 start_codon:yes stop_codon:yes gene_type:complete